MPRGYYPRKAKTDKDKADSAPADEQKQDADLTAPFVPEPPVEESPAKVERRPATKPWEKGSSYRPWRRDFFKLQRNHKGFHCRFVNPENVESRLDRGYVIANPDDYGGLMDSDIKDGGSLGRRIERRRMILMEIPEEGARAYREANREFIRSRQRKNEEEMQRIAKESGIPVQVTQKGF